MRTLFLLIFSCITLYASEVTTEPSDTHLIHSQMDSTQNIQRLICGGGGIFLNSTPFQSAYSDVELKIVMEDLVFIGFESLVLLKNNHRGGLGGFLNVGRNVTLNDRLHVFGAGGFGYVLLPLSEKKHRYFWQGKTGVVIGDGNLRLSLSYSLMGGNALAHRTGAQLVWYRQRRES